MIKALTVMAWDTATPWCVIALARTDGRQTEVLAEFRGEPGPSHSNILAPKAEAMLAAAGLSPRQLELVAVGRGPGSFTGLRTGLALAKGLALGAGLSIWGVSTLETLAGGVFFEDPDPELLVAPVVDARHNEVFAALYGRGDGLEFQELLPPTPVKPAAVTDTIAPLAAGRPWRLTGPGLKLPEAAGEGAGPEECRPPDPVVLARLAAGRFLAGRALAPPEPLYVRPPDIRSSGLKL